MKKTYLTLCIIGFILPNIWVTIESYETGNILLYMDPVATFQRMFANRISMIFAIDLFFAVAVFFIWSYHEAKQSRMKHLWVVWVFTMLLGLAGGFPLFLYLRKRQQQ
ncbi:MAG: DUF2834 domain-containing protein [Cytophagales bacterium]|nr:DUF2834 domain-containing protein [Cytophagales bacterium]